MMAIPSPLYMSCTPEPAALPVEIFDVLVPHGVAPGEFFQCQIPGTGNNYRVQVPVGAVSGGMMRVHIASSPDAVSRAEPPRLAWSDTPAYQPWQPVELRSITFRGLGRLVEKLASDLQLPNGQKMTSHQVAALFKGQRGAGIKFRPQAHPEYMGFFSPAAPTVAVTYAWSTCLLREFPAFIAEFEKKSASSEELTYWVDVFFNDQNAGTNMNAELERAELVYRTSRYHAVFVLNDPLSRGWCLLEIATRTIAANQDQNVLPSVFVAVKGLTEVKDWTPKTGHFGITEYFRSIRTFDPKDRAAIQRRILEIYGSSYKFNHCMNRHLDSCRNAILRVEHHEAGGAHFGALCAQLLRTPVLQMLKIRYESFMTQWPENLRFKPNKSGTCCWCDKQRSEHTEPEGRCYLPDLQNEHAWWHYGTPLPITCNLVVWSLPCCWPFLVIFYVWGGDNIPGSVGGTDIQAHRIGPGCCARLLLQYFCEATCGTCRVGFIPALVVLLIVRVLMT